MSSVQITELALVYSEKEQIKDIEGSFNPSSVLFCLLLSNSRIIFLLLEERNFNIYFGKKSQPNK